MNGSGHDTPHFCWGRPSGAAIPVRHGPVVALVAGGAVTAATTALLEASPVTAVLLGTIYGTYAWALRGYPIARRLHFRRLGGRDFWLGPALLIALGAALAVPLTLALPPRQAALLVLTLVGSLLAVGTLAGLLAHNDCLIDHDWL